jgi:hypothetical protein
MSFLKYFYNLFSKEASDKTPELNAKVRLSEQEVKELSQTYATKIDWISENVIQTQPQIKYENNKIIWEIFFNPKMPDNLPVKGGHLILYIDDETGNLLKKVIGTR